MLRKDESFEDLNYFYLMYIRESFNYPTHPSDELVFRHITGSPITVDSNNKEEDLYEQKTTLGHFLRYKYVKIRKFERTFIFPFTFKALFVGYIFT